jgi:hypothetical protein
VPSRIPLKLLRKRNALAYELQQIIERANTIEEELQALDYAIPLIEPTWKPPDRASRPGDEKTIKNQAHQVIYKSVLRKLSDLLDRRQKFLDESARLYLDDYQKYRDDSAK